MIAHFKSIHIDLWDVVENGDYIPYDDQLNEIPSSQWTEQQRLKFLLNSKAWNVMLCAISEEEYTKVHNFRSRTYDNYVHIDKILRCMSKKWRPQVTVLRALKNLESVSLEELVNTFKVHEQELHQDEGLK
ncbi:hypothetical protein GYH30_004585 [Glycine max]|uniref:DUF4219 domain-containing protein n=1 Tax=Glycine max TaxID=3847 RepID=A0A0R0L6G5_SOYBN|nr:hypothetical protein GYH30_004585 [Glycine max]